MGGALGTERSQKALASAYAQQRARSDSPLIYLRDRPDSAAFYSRGKAQRVDDVAAFEARLSEQPGALFAIRARDLAALPDADTRRLEVLGSFGDFRLLGERPLAPR